MPPSLLFTMRTADRSPKPNYLGQTVRSLIVQGVLPTDIHLLPTDPAIAWLETELGKTPVSVHAPQKHRKPNANGLAPIALLETYPADWIVLSEDDLEWCGDPLGSIARWLDDHATPERAIYRFFAFDDVTRAGHGGSVVPCREQKGSQVVALRAADARRFKLWAEAHPTNWRPTDAPFQNRPHDGFDKLLGYWALSEDPHATGLVSRPFFVRHLGVESALHGRGLRRDREFAGTDWRYPVKVAA